MDLDKKKVATAVQVLKKLLELDAKKKLLEEVNPIQIQICVKKIPPKEKTVKLIVPNGLQSENQEVCLFVKDLDGGKDREYEPTIEYFKELLKKQNIAGISEIIPLKSLKLEYKPFEAKRNLSNGYDMFLADARILRLLPSYLGKHFFGTKKSPVQVDLQSKTLKEDIKGALNNSRCVISSKGSSSVAVVANLEMGESLATDNIMACVTQIAASMPGGWDNIKQLSIKTPSSTSIPIYMSSGAPQDVNIPKPEIKREPIVAEEIDTLFGAKVKVYPSGEVKVIPDIPGEEANEIPDRRRKRKRSESRKKKAGKAKSDEEGKKPRKIAKTTEVASDDVLKRNETNNAKRKKAKKTKEFEEEKPSTQSLKKQELKPKKVSQKTKEVSKESKEKNKKEPPKIVKKKETKKLSPADEKKSKGKKTLTKVRSPKNIAKKAKT